MIRFMLERVNAGVARQLGVVLVFLLAMHAGALLLFKTDPGYTLVLFLVHAFFTGVGLLFVKPVSERSFSLYCIGYFILFSFFFVFLKAYLLFVIFLFLYSALYKSRYLLGLLIIYILCVVLLRPYSMQAFVLLAFIFSVSLAVFRRARSVFLLACFIAGAIALFFLVLPVLYLITQSSPQTVFLTLSEDGVRRALYMSLFSTSVSTVIVCALGTPLAYAMARASFPGKELFNTLIDIPILIPQSIVGIAILLISGHKTPLGVLLRDSLGVEVGGTVFGVIAAQVFVSAPFYIRTAITSFESVDRRIENVARTLGASHMSAFIRVVFPLSANGLFTGVILAWSRAISEFGSVMLVAYHPMTLPVFSYDRFIQYGLAESRPAAVLMLLVCLWIFILLRMLRTWSPFRVPGNFWTVSDTGGAV